MYIRLNVIDPDGDTLIILPTTQIEAAKVNNNQGVSASDPKNSGDDITEALAMWQEVVESGAAENITSEVTFHFKVSMKHLTLASTRASKVLQGRFSEAAPQETDGLRHWEFEPIFDPIAFNIVMKIIHAKTRKLPDQISLHMLANIAAIVDDLQCLDSVEPFISRWIGKLNIETPAVLCIALAEIILISSVFQLPELFKKSTHEAITSSTGDMPSYGLPIWPTILTTIDDKRTSLLKERMKPLYNVGTDIEKEPKCLNCKAASIGLLIYNLRSQRLPTSASSAEWTDLSLKSLKKKMSSFKYGSLFTPCEKFGRPQHPTLKTVVQSTLKSFDQGIEGLSLIPLISTE